MATIRNWKKRFGRKSGKKIKSYIDILSVWHKENELIGIEFNVYDTAANKELNIELDEHDIKKLKKYFDKSRHE